MAITRLSNLVRKGSAGATPSSGSPMAFADAAASRQDSSLPPSDASSRQTAPARAEPVYYDMAVQEIGRLYQAAADAASIRIAALQRTMEAFVNELLAGDDLLLKSPEPGESHADRARHMVNCAVFAVKIGQGAGARENELLQLALAASVHDIGMVIVPSRILNKPSTLSNEERDLVRMHPEKGFRLLQGLGQELEWLPNVVIQHHEREDGSGYPRGLEGDEIAEMAKIIGLADTYEALTHPRPYHPETRYPLEVVKEIIATERYRFPSHLLKGFIRGLSTFPIGSWVRLNTGETARVVATNPTFPLRPTIEIIADANGGELDRPRCVDLSLNTLLHITEASRGVRA
jgi:HD-GYP domain-containing protein (c-di-GMP phosphodiesterase class II)